MSWFTFTWQNFLYSFLALAFEGLPFVLVGSLISGAKASAELNVSSMDCRVILPFDPIRGSG